MKTQSVRGRRAGKPGAVNRLSPSWQRSPLHLAAARSAAQKPGTCPSRGPAARGSYLAADRVDAQYACKGICSWMSKPSGCVGGAQENMSLPTRRPWACGLPHRPYKRVGNVRLNPIYFKIEMALIKGIFSKEGQEPNLFIGNLLYKEPML